jgi:ABC-2 type transport system ATP-binding protein
MAVIETGELGHSYGNRRGILNVNLRIAEGQICGFLGPNGAGKTTTIRILLGFLRPSKGYASIFERDCWKFSRLIKQDIGYVAGDVRLYPWLTLRRGLRMIQSLRAISIASEGFRLCDRFQVDPDLPVRKMSRGNRQKVALILALSHRPKLIILDEPTSGLDPIMQLTLMEILREAAAEGRTVLFSSHSLSEIESLCHHVLMIRQGEIVVDEGLLSLQSRAPRIVRLKAQPGCQIDLSLMPKNVTSTRQVDAENVELLVEGPAKQVAHWATGQPIEDISISPPSLEQLFHDYYTQSDL